MRTTSLLKFGSTLRAGGGDGKERLGHFIAKPVFDIHCELFYRMSGQIAVKTLRGPNAAFFFFVFFFPAEHNGFPRCNQTLLERTQPHQHVLTTRALKQMCFPQRLEAPELVRNSRIYRRLEKRKEKKKPTHPLHAKWNPNGQIYNKQRPNG